MRRRILTSILVVTAIAVALFGIPLAFVVQRFVDENAVLRVERQAVLAARTVPGDFLTSNDPVELPDTQDGIVLALYDRSGTLVAGRGPAHADATTTGALGNDVTDTELSNVRIVAVPVTGNEAVLGAIRAEQSTASSDARSRRILTLLGLLALGVIAIGALVSYVVAGLLARPVRRLRDAAVRLGRGDFTTDVPPSGVPELDQAADALTNTARRLDDLVTRERAFSADASHQLRTPLAGLRAAIETELAYPRTDPTELLRESLDDIDRLELTITELLSIARTSRSNAESVALAELFTEVTAKWRGTFAASGRRLSVTDPHDSPRVRGNGTVLRHALDVLLDNALNHGAGEVRIRHHVANDSVTISITDEGPGFSDTPSAGLHGLGLPLARRLIESIPGRLTIVHSGPNPRVDITLHTTAVIPPST